MHADSCEQAYDKPLLYEAGWGKPLQYVIGCGGMQFVCTHLSVSVLYTCIYVVCARMFVCVLCLLCVECGLTANVCVCTFIYTVTCCSHVLKLSAYEVSDVTHRYTRKWAEVQNRRTAMTEQRLLGMFAPQ